MTNPTCKMCNGSGKLQNLVKMTFNDDSLPRTLEGNIIECPDCTKPDEVKVCPKCKNQGWVCEDHSETPWNWGDGCCGGAGEPCLCSPEYRSSRVEQSKAKLNNFLIKNKLELIVLAPYARDLNLGLKYEDEIITLSNNVDRSTNTATIVYNGKRENPYITK